MGAFAHVGNADRASTERRFEQLIGNSPALEWVLEQVERVSPTDSTVLIQGETGTGKELIARAIHNISSRCGRPFVKLNCAAVPLDLLESELFGHEKRIHRAIAQKDRALQVGERHAVPGRIGRYPAGLATKLLRVLRAEFRAAGWHSGPTGWTSGWWPQPTDLTEMAARGEFCSDLYYRLNVFPILLPPRGTKRIFRRWYTSSRCIRAGWIGVSNKSPSDVGAQRLPVAREHPRTPEPD